MRRRLNRGRCPKRVHRVSGQHVAGANGDWKQVLEVRVPATREGTPGWGQMAVPSWLARLSDLHRSLAMELEDARTATAVLDPVRGLHPTEGDIYGPLKPPQVGSLTCLSSTSPWFASLHTP